MAYTYERYASFFDLVIYSALFIALCNVVFQRQFPGRAGKAMSTALGIMLGVSMAYAQSLFGWNIGKAAPFAIVIVILLIGFLLLHTMTRLHITWDMAFPLTYVVMYLFFRAMTPLLFEGMMQRVPFINILSLVIFLICLWRVGAHLWMSLATRTRHPDNIKTILTDNSIVHDEKRALRAEKSLKGRDIKAASAITKRLKTDLRSVIKELERSQPNYQEIERVLGDIKKEAHALDAHIRRVLVLDERLMKFDYRQIDILRKYYEQLSDEDKKKLKQYIRLEHEKIIKENGVHALCVSLKKRHVMFVQAVEQVMALLRHGNADEARRHAQTALSLEAKQQHDIARLRKAESLLIELTRRKLRKERRQ